MGWGFLIPTRVHAAMFRSWRRTLQAGADRMTLLAFAENRNVSACAPALDATATAVGVCANATCLLGVLMLLGWRLD